MKFTEALEYADGTVDNSPPFPERQAAIERLAAVFNHGWGVRKIVITDSDGDKWIYKTAH